MSGMQEGPSVQDPYGGGQVHPRLSQLTATVLTRPRFLFTPQEARELLPPLPPQEVTAGRVSHAAACHPGPAVVLQTASQSEAEPGRRAGSSGRTVPFLKEGPSGPGE